VCTLRGMVPVSKTSCGCRKGESFKNGACRPDRPECPRGQVFNGKRCVEQQTACKPGQIQIGKRCVTKPNCPRGQVAIPGTGICVKLGGGRPKDNDVVNPPKGDNCKDPAKGRPIPCP
jgi:hypothetical protein